MAAWRKRVLSFIATGVVALPLTACDSACEDAQEKLDECKDEIARAGMTGGSLPIAVSELGPAHGFIDSSRPAP